MAVPIALREDFDAAALRGLARRRGMRTKPAASGVAGDL